MEGGERDGPVAPARVLGVAEAVLGRQRHRCVTPRLGAGAPVHELTDPRQPRRRRVGAVGPLVVARCVDERPLEAVEAANVLGDLSIGTRRGLGLEVTDVDREGDVVGIDVVDQPVVLHLVRLGIRDVAEQRDPIGRTARKSRHDGRDGRCLQDSTNMIPPHLLTPSLYRRAPIAAPRVHPRPQLAELSIRGARYPVGNFSSPPHHDLVVTEPDGSPVHPQVFSRRFGTIAKSAGLPMIRLHDIRHSYATAALAAGAGLKVVSQRLGHADVGVTLRVYAHVLAGDDEAVANLVAAAITGS
ncbi:MAG: tyrosine-type recombinase/integrase [Acidimicrobiia bacterium]|nr:tyrosine-type recombinase/integrase [Acidimicrobiia bacterium]